MKKRLLSLFTSAAIAFSCVFAGGITAGAVKSPAVSGNTRIEFEEYSEWSKGTSEFVDTNDLRIVELNGFKQVEGTSNGAWLKYENVDFSDGRDSVSVRQASNALRCCKDARLEIRLGSLTGELLAKVSLPATGTATGDWSKYSVEQVKLERIVEGVGDIFVLLRGTDDLTTNPTKTVIANLDYLSFTFEAKYRDPITQKAADKINALPEENKITSEDGETIKSALASFSDLAAQEQAKMTDESLKLSRAVEKYMGLSKFKITYINLPKSATFSKAGAVTLIAPGDFDMYYTTDGSSPDPENPLAKRVEKGSSAKIAVTGETTVKAAVSTLLGMAKAASETYKVVPVVGVKSFSATAPASVTVGKTARIKVTKIEPSNASDKKITYKVLSGGVSVSGDGVIKGLRASAAKLEVRAGAVKRIINIKVKSTATAIKVSKSAVKIRRGKRTKALTKYFSVKAPTKSFLLKTKYTFKPGNKFVKIKSNRAVVSKRAKKGKIAVKVYSGKKLLGKIILKIV